MLPMMLRGRNEAVKIQKRSVEVSIENWALFLVG